MLKSGVRAGPGGDLASAPAPCRSGWSRVKGWREECGVFAAIGVPNAAQAVGLGLHALQHRGQESAGIVSSTDDGVGGAEAVDEAGPGLGLFEGLRRHLVEV